MPPAAARNFHERPLLVFWETTKACPLVCKHCRASAVTQPLPGELTTDEAARFLDGLREFGPPPPILVLTGGDVMCRDDLFEVLDRAREHRLPATLAPAVSERLTERAFLNFLEAGVKTISISLDGEKSSHERIRGTPGHWERTVDAIRSAVACGLRVQVNTCVMRENVADLPAVFERLGDLGVSAWEVFFLIQTGRGVDVKDLAPIEYEAVAHFLYDASCRGLVVRTVEAPFLRRVVLEREGGGAPPETPLYRALASGFEPPGDPPRCLAQSAGTRDGHGIVFVAHDGAIAPGGFLPIPCGNVRTDSVCRVYRDHPLFLTLRAPERFGGRCGGCEYRDVCGGSRARAFARYGDPLREDPACAYVPRAPVGGAEMVRPTASHRPPGTE
jgi:radical SAM protein